MFIQIVIIIENIDSALLYRMEAMSSHGWAMTRALYKTELEDKWPVAETVCGNSFDTNFETHSLK